MILTTIIMITANITPYFALGKATPRILLGLNSSLLFSSDINLKRAPQQSSAQILF
jgi:hypothetical protein